MSDSSHTLATWAKLETSVEKPLGLYGCANRHERDQACADRRKERAENGKDEQHRFAARLPPQDEVVHRRESEEPDERGIDGDVGAQGHTSRHRWLPEDYRKFKPGTELLRGPR